MSSLAPTRRKALQLSAGLLAGMLLAPARVFADEVEVSATLGAETTEVGQGVYLQIEVATERDLRIGEPTFPGLKNADVQLQSTSSGMSVQFVNGRRSAQRTKTFIYVLTPSAPGELEIPIEVEVGSDKYRPASKPKLGVGGSAQVEPTPEQPEVGALPDSAEREVYVWPVVDAAEVYVGEQVIYELQIWSRTNGRLELSDLPSFKDAWTSDMQIFQPKQRKRIDGVYYQVFTQLRRAVFPQRAGTLTIPGAKLQVFPSIDFFGGGGGPPRSFTGQTLAIPVKPLPAEGQPANFAPNNVGQYAIAAEVDRTELRQGEAVRLSVTVEGTGNLELLELRKWPEIADARTYEPTAAAPELDTRGPRLRGKRTWTMLLVAERAGTLEIPAIELAFFDPSAAAYRVVKTKPITLEVAPDPDAPIPPDEDEAKPGERSSTEQTELLAPPFAGDVLARVEPRVPWLTPQRWWVGILAVPALIGSVWLGRYSYLHFGSDQATRQRAAAKAQRRLLLSQAKAAIDGGEGFHAKLAELLQGLALARVGTMGVGLTRERLMALLRQAGVPAEEVERMQELLDACDAARFGADLGDPQSRRVLLEQTQALIDSETWRVLG